MPTPTETLAAALDALTADGDPTAAAALDRWEPQHWREALLDLPLDEHGYYDRFHRHQRAEIERLWTWWTGTRGHRHTPETVGLLGLYLLTVTAVHCSERARFHGETTVTYTCGDTQVTAAHLSTELVADPRVRNALKTLYDPAATGPAPQDTLDQWALIDFDTLRFHRHGTTSIILYGKSADPKKSRRTEFALKCIVYPYQRLPAIADATRTYADRFDTFIPDDAPLVVVWASHDNWILQDFLTGQTLAERLRTRPRTEPRPRRTAIRPIDIAELDLLGNALLYALADLVRLGYRHEDLSPSNIIVQDFGSTARMRFIDLGVNHLHTRTLPGESYGEAVYVAPEVRKGGHGDDQADLYSLGRLLLAISGSGLGPDGSLPDHTYVLSTGMARLLEDLVDADPDRRLLVTPIEPPEAPESAQGRNRIDQIRELFQREMEVIREAARLEPEGAMERLKDLLPGSGTVSRQGRIMRVRQRQAAAMRDQGRTADVSRLRQAQRLRRWAWGAAFLLWGTAALVATWWLEDLGIGWQAKWIEVVNIALAKAGSDFDFFAAMRMDGYVVPDPWGNLPARLVGFSFALVNARLYLNLFAEISPLSSLPRRGRHRFLTYATEFGLRSMAVLPSLCVILPTLVQGDWWPLATQIGLVWTAAVFSVFIAFERDIHRRARTAGLSTVPEGEFPPGRLARWRPTLVIYCVPVLGIGTLIMLDLVQDELVYASFVSLINLSIYYFKSAGADAPRVRTELSRAFLAAERLDRLDARDAGQSGRRMQTRGQRSMPWADSRSRIARRPEVRASSASGANPSRS